MICSPATQRARDAEAAVAGAVAAVRDPSVMSADEVLELFRRFEAMARLAGAAKLLLATRIDESGEARRQGKASTADLLAELSGTSVGAAKSDLGASKALSGLPETAEALLGGEVSPEQAKVIAGAARTNPAAQRRLLGAAKAGSHDELRQEAARVRAEADPDPEATHRRIHSERRLSMWVDDEGVWHLKAQGTPTDGALIQKALDRETDRVFRAQATAAAHEPRDAYRFDALKGLTTQPPAGGGRSGRQPAPQHLALLRLDVAALRRGAVGDGELCEIVGVGPVPVSVAKALLGDAVLKLLITDGIDVLNVTSLTRGPTQAMRYATLWTSPTCTVAGCDRTICEYDHITGAEYKDTRHTRLDELDHTCTCHHDLHTRLGWALVPGTGKRPMVPPGHPDHPTRPGPRTDPSPAPPTGAECAEIAQAIRLARDAVRDRRTGRAPPDPATRGVGPEPAGAAPTRGG